MENKKPTVQKEFIYFRESALQSFAADVVTFGFLFGGFLLNRFVLYGRWYIDIFFIILFFIVSGARANKRGKRFNSAKELKEYVDKTVK